MKLSELFERCLSVPYVHLSEGADYAMERDGSTLYLYLEHSRGEEDWKNNLDFPARPYKRGDGSMGLAHGGFLRVWRGVERAVSSAVSDPAVQGIVIVGYSHGAALAVLCHEFVWFSRPDLRERIFGVGFGAPRVIWGLADEETLSQWDRFWVIRNPDDAVTHLPPSAMGYTHVGHMLELSEVGSYSPIDAHRPENLLTELLRYEKTDR